MPLCHIDKVFESSTLGLFHNASDRPVTDNSHTPRRGLRIPVTGLKVGMRICDLDRDWLDTPFALQGFDIRSNRDIAEVARYCEFVYIEPPASAQQPARDAFVFMPAGGKKALDDCARTYDEARSVTRTLLDDVRLGRAIDIKAVKATVSQCVRAILDNPDAMHWISRLRERGDYTAEHSLNVAMLAISFGHSLGASEDDLIRMGLAGILHDVGKMRVPPEILDKPGRLTPDEFTEVKKHSRYGRDVLLSLRNIGAAVDVAYSHHEMLDGTGYPRGISAESISQTTRIITLCDVYDAITNDRCYKDAQPALEALRIIYNERGRQFDESLAEQFIRHIGIYPAGSIVELHSGEVGIVISTNEHQRHLPKVLLVRDAHKQSMTERVINLEQAARAHDDMQLIAEAKPNGAYGIRIEDYVKRGLNIS